MRFCRSLRLLGVTDLLIDTLAAWRLTRLAGTDKITEAQRDHLVEFIMGFGPTRLGGKALQLMDCPYCLSVWAAGLVIVLKHLPLGKSVVRLLAISAVAGELSNRLDSWSE